MPELTPMMRQYQEIKAQHPDKILLFRVGDFYETFFDDAVLAAKELNIALTSRDGGQVPLAGVPFHALNTYLARLISRGYKVAICEQVENPAEAKGLVRREVTRIVTPGTVFEDGILEEKRNNYLVSVTASAGRWGLAYVDVSTGEMGGTVLDGRGELADEIGRLQPREAICHRKELQPFLHELGIPLVESMPEAYITARTMPLLKRKFGLSIIESGREKEEALTAAGALLFYLQGLQNSGLEHVNHFYFYGPGDFMELDTATRRNLELTETLRERSRKGSLLWVIDRTVTSAGGRLLRRWLERPLKSLQQLQVRQGAVSELVDWGLLREELLELLRNNADLERLTGRAIFGSLLPREMGALRDTLKTLPAIVQRLRTVKSDGLIFLREQIPNLEDFTSLLEKALVDEPPSQVREGGIIRQGYNQEVDRLRSLSRQRKEWILNLESRERERTGIKSLKVGFNKVFGYYIEVTRANLSLVPDDYIRKQTLVNGERYITEELKRYEEEVLGAETKLKDLEYRLYEELRQKLVEKAELLQQAAAQLACLDCYLSLARTALANRYCRPRLVDSRTLDLRQLRHPVVEVLQSDAFIPNDAYMSGEERMLLITGPNMAGKSTYCRSVALAVILAQIGSFVPAASATIGIADRVFARVGAGDDLAGGVSTFMLEMQETAAILLQASSKSLVVLDEVGRGTSTFDGMSIARAVIEDLHTRVGCRTLFSTHYHELTSLEESLEGLRNYTMAVEEKGNQVVFLRQVVPGKADRSYGVNVARLAGLPTQVVETAALYLKQIEQARRETGASALGEQTEDVGQQHTPTATGPQNDPLRALLVGIDPDSLSPREALDIIYEIRGILSSEGGRNADGKDKSAR